MLAKTYSAALQGIEAYKVEVEVNATGAGENTLVTIVGLPDTAVRESRERVESALGACGFLHPFGKTVVNLAPADIKKEGAAFDLPIAAGMIAAGAQLERDTLANKMFVGELALDGKLRPAHGILAIAFLAKQLKMQTLIVPEENAAEAGIVEGLEVIGVRNLVQTVGWLKGEVQIAPTRTNVREFFEAERGKGLDFGDIKGQELVKRVMEIAADGGHNVLMIGPPGTGKSMAAQRLPSILPLMTFEEALETTKIHSIAGHLSREHPLVVQRPFRAPHHTISDAGLLGGQSTPSPGEISLAHNGVIFMDELPEFRRSALEVMRQPIEDRTVTISRAVGSFTFPANFQLVAAMNPCPCGYYGSGQRACRCTSHQINRYRAKISGPLLDRIDIHVEAAPISEKELLERPSGENSAQIRERVIKARAIQQRRFPGTKISCNAMMGPRELQEHCGLDAPSRQLLKMAINDLSLSARAYDRVLRVARTLADLEGAGQLASHHISEAVQYRTLDRQLW